MCHVSHLCHEWHQPVVCGLTWNVDIDHAKIATQPLHFQSGVCNILFNSISNAPGESLSPSAVTMVP